MWWEQFKTYINIPENEKIIIKLAAVFLIIVNLFDSFIPPVLIVSCIVFLFYMLADDVLTIKNLLVSPPCKVYESRGTAIDDLKDYIKANKTKTAYIISYNTAYYYDIVHSLNKAKTNVFLLIKFTKETSELNHTVSNIRHLVDTIDDYSGLKILCYESEPSIRGTNIDNELINIGWYSNHSCNNKKKVKGSPLSLTFTKDCDNFRDVDKFYNDVFIDLWKNSEDLISLLSNYKDYNDLEESFISWCKGVTPVGNKGQREMSF